MMAKTFTLFLLSLMLVFPLSSTAQNINEAVDIEDLGFTFPLNPGARPAGLAGAYQSIGGDVHSLVYNPAGLARNNRIELSIGFQYERGENDITFYDIPNGADNSTTTLDHISIAYPFPTYRGSMVGAFGIYRTYSSELDLLYSGFNDDTNTIDNYILQQSGSIFSYNFGFAIDLSPNLSGGGSFFILDGTIKALTQFDFENPGPIGPDEIRQYFLVDDAEVNLDGYGGKVGIQFYPNQVLTFGLTVTTPIWISLRGDAYLDESIYYGSPPDETNSEVFLIDQEYRIPFRIDGGVSVTPISNILLCVDIGYTDWSQASINKVRLKDERLRSIFSQVVDVCTGVEIGLPWAPVRFRGGYAYKPYALEYLQADRITNDAIEKASIDTERHMFAIGAGGLISKVFAVDLAYTYTTGERSIPTQIHLQKNHHFLLSGSYRF